MESKMDSDLDHEFSPNSPPRGHYSDLGPKGAQKEPKGDKRVPKDLKMIQNDMNLCWKYIKIYALPRHGGGVAAGIWIYIYISIYR